MNVNGYAFGDINAHEGVEKSPRIGFTPDVLPEALKPVLAESSQIGASTKNGMCGTIFKAINKKLLSPKGYVLCVTYDREQNEYNYFISKKVEAFYHMIKLIEGRKIYVKESRFPNKISLRAERRKIKSYVYANVNLPHFRLYYHPYSRRSTNHKNTHTYFWGQADG